MSFTLFANLGTPAMDSVAEDVPSNYTTLATVSNTTSTPTTVSTTTDLSNYNNQPNQSMNCLPFNSTELIANTSSTDDGVKVKVSCSVGYRVLALQTGHSDVFTCSHGIWSPTTPTCTLSNTSQIPIGIVVGCTVGAVVCLMIILFAFYMMHRNNKDNKLRIDKDKLKTAKMMHMDYFMTAFQERDDAAVTVLPSATTSGYGSTGYGAQTSVEGTSMHPSHSRSSLTEVEIHRDSDSTSSIGDSASIFEENQDTVENGK